VAINDALPFEAARRYGTGNLKSFGGLQTSTTTKDSFPS